MRITLSAYQRAEQSIWTAVALLGKKGVGPSLCLSWVAQQPKVRLLEARHEAGRSAHRSPPEEAPHVHHVDDVGVHHLGRVLPIPSAHDLPTPQPAISGFMHFHAAGST